MLGKNEIHLSNVDIRFSISISHQKIIVIYVTLCYIADKKTLYVTGKSLRKVTENENLKIMATLFKYYIMLKYDYDNHEI